MKRMRGALLAMGVAVAVGGCVGAAAAAAVLALAGGDGAEVGYSW